MKERLRGAAGVVALLATGFLLGSLWLEWRPAEGPASGAPPDGAAPEAGVPDLPQARPRVEVLNGLGREGAARRAAERLRTMGFDVVYFGNAGRFDHRRTRVWRRSADSAAARRLADSLGVADVAPRPEPGLHVDGTVVLGADWDSLVRRRDSVRASGARSTLHALLERLGL